MTTSIKHRIYLSFLLLASLFLVNAVFTVFILLKNKEMAAHIRTVVEPSLKQLDEFHDLVIQSKMYSTNWVFLRASQDDKDSLQRIHSTDYINLKTELLGVSENWRGKSNRDSLQLLFHEFENLLAVERKIMEALQQFSDYDDPVKKLQAEGMIEDEVIPRTKLVTATLFRIIAEERKIRLIEETKLESSFKLFWGLVIFLALIIVIVALVLSKYLTLAIVKPIRQMRLIVHDLGRGVTNKIEQSYKEDEIGEMVAAVNQLSDKLKYTATFAQETGKRKFDVPFQPLSEEDTLGKALIHMRDSLKSVDESLNLAQHIAKLGSWEWNIKTNAIFWSDEMYLIFGKDAAAFVPSYEGFMDCVHQEDRPFLAEQIDGCLQHHQPYSGEFRILTRSGAAKILFIQGNVSLDENNQVTKLFGIVQDITERKKFEEALQLKNKELEQFAYITSHDLQEPLRTITSFSDHFQKMYAGNLDETGQKFLNYIVQGANRMRVLIQDLLEYSRIGRKQEIAPVDCNEIVNTVIEDLTTVIQESRAEIKTGKLPVIRGYSTEIKQLFQNLITNAIKFRKKDDRPQIHIISRSIGGGYEFTVRDNGIGIPEEHSERIFVIFQRLHNRTEYEGSGIGLSNCKKIVELHGGKIWVKSKPGEGSAFHFTILENHN